MAEEEPAELIPKETAAETDSAAGSDVEKQSFTEEVKDLRDEIVTTLKKDDDDLLRQLRKRSQERRELFLGLYKYSGQLLVVAGQYNRLQNIIDLLPDIDVNAVDSKGRTPLHAAAENGNLEAVKMLVQRDARWDIPDDKGMLPLHSALRSRQPSLEVIRLLVEKCAEGGSTLMEVGAGGGLDAKRAWLCHPVDDMGNTPLHTAATTITADYDLCLRYVQELKRFDPCVKNTRGDTPLHTVARRGDVPLTEAMLKVFYGFEKDVDNHPTNRDGDSLLDIAATSGFDNLVVLLLDYGADPRQGVLFKVVCESVRRPQMSGAMQRMYHLVIDNVGKWSNGQDKEEVVNIIDTFSEQNGDRNVVEFAIDEGAVEMLREIVHTDALYEFHTKGKYRFLLRYCHPSKERISLLERMVSCDKAQIGAQMLSIQPFNYMTSQYLWYSSVLYAIFFTLQFIYMLFFTYFCIPNACELSIHFQLGEGKCTESEAVPTSYDQTIRNKVGFIVWPLLTLIFNICLKLCQFGGTVFVRRLEIIAQLFSLTFGTLIVFWFVFLVRAESYELFTGFSAFVFIFGWLQTLYYLSYLGELYIFTNLVKAIIFNDFLKLASFLTFVLAGFSCAIHSIEQTEFSPSNRTLADTFYLTLASTFNLGDLFDDTMGDSVFARSGGNLDLLRIIFIAYLIASFVILLNVLIAMMSDTYQFNNRNAKEIWKFDVLKVSLTLMIARKARPSEVILPEKIAEPIIRCLPDSDNAADDKDTTLLPF